MKQRIVAIPCSLALALVACSEAEEVEPAPEPELEIEATPIAGRYQVDGITIAVESGYKRKISGTVILAAQDDAYTATFNLVTTYPDPAAAEPIRAEVIGRGEGTIEGRTLRGTAHTQIVAATVPNVDPGFAFIPRSVSTRIVSTSTATVAADGTLSIEIENQPAAGEPYKPTRTTLSGRRVPATEEVGES